MKRTLALEVLQSRLLLAADISFDVVFGQVSIKGTAGKDDVTVEVKGEQLVVKSDKEDTLLDADQSV